MNTLELLDWLDAVSAQVPEIRCDELRHALKNVSSLSGDGVWQAGIGARAGFKALAVRYLGGRADAFREWIAAASNAFGAAFPSAGLRAPAADWPWLSLIWDGNLGRLEEIAVLGHCGRGPGAAAGRVSRGSGAGSERRSVTLGRFLPGMFGEAGLREALERFHRLCPVAGTVVASVPGRLGGPAGHQSWSLRLRDPLAWPLFLRLDFAAPFAAHAALSAFLNLNRGIRELAFQREDLWAYFE